MCQVDRGKYINSCDAYVDAPQGIGFGATISAPHMVNVYYYNHSIIAE